MSKWDLFQECKFGLTPQTQSDNTLQGLGTAQKTRSFQWTRNSLSSFAAAGESLHRCAC